MSSLFPFNPFSRLLMRRFAFLCFFFLLVAGCQRSDSTGFGAETDEPDYRRGQQLVKAGRQQEALTAFLNVIEKRGEDAPESHLEVGLIELQYVKDPIAAIYHFRKYLELKPNSQQADLVRQRIETAMRDFARTLPAQPLENQIDRLDLMELVDKLKRENDQLKADLAAARSGTAITAASPPAAPRTSPSSTAGTASPAISLANPSPLARSNPSNVAPPSTPASRTVLPTTTPSRSTPTVPAKPSGRRYTVGSGDSLSKISMKIYGDRTHVNDIFNANKDIMRTPNDLRAGMDLKLP